MSLILDALRKSEAERERGAVPGLFSRAPSLPTRPRAPWRGIATGAAIAGAVMAVALWAWRAGPPDAREEIGDQAQASADTPAPATVVPADREPPRMASLPAPTDPVATSPAQAAPPASVPAMPVAVPATVAPPPPPAALPSPAPAMAPPAGPAMETPPPDDAVPIAVLSAAERSSLPPLKLSMHVWNSDPARRFAIVDGQRVAEGGLVGSAVVEEIRRDGVVLNINGRRLLLARP